MKKTFIILSLSFFVINVNAQGKWTQLADFGSTARANATGFSIGNKGYLGTGYDGNTYRKDFWEYDPATNAWTQKADFGGTERVSAVGFSIGSKGYIGAGSIAFQQYQNDFWEYDPLQNTWTRKTDFAGAARNGATGFGLNNKGYVGIGSNATDVLKDFWEYDPATNTWLQKADFGGVKRGTAASFTIGNKGYIGTGDGYSDFWEYDPSLNIWTQKANYGGGGTQNSIGFSINNKGYIALGGSNNTIWEWDPATDQWTKKTNFYGGTYFTVGFSIGNKGYVGTGKKNGTFDKGFWSFDNDCPITASFTSSLDTIYMDNSISFTNTSVGATNYLWKLNGDSVSTSTNLIDTFKFSGSYLVELIAKGTCSDTSSATINVLTGDWAKRAFLLGGVREGAAGFSIGGKGYIGTGSFKNDLWEYDQATNGWTQKADLPAKGRQHAVGFSIGNKGYLGTGAYYDSTSVNQNLKDFWEYDPSTNSWLQKADFGGVARQYAVGFSIGNNGYILTGNDGDILSGSPLGTRQNDFWEYNPITNSWLQKANFTGAARDRAVGFSIGQKGFIGTGYSGAELKDFWEWDKATDVWTQKTSLPSSAKARLGAVGFSLNGKGIIGQGYGNATELNDFWEYDTLLNAWAKIPIIGDSKQFAVGFSIKNKGYVGFGKNGATDFWEYNPANCGVSASFNSCLDIEQYNGLAQSTTTIGRGNYLNFYNYSSVKDADFTWKKDGSTFATTTYYNPPFGPKYTFNSPGTYKISLIAYYNGCSDTTSQNITVICGGTFTKKANFPATARAHSVGFSIGNKGYIGTGTYLNSFGSNIPLKDFWEYDPATNAWTQKADFGGSARAGAVGFSIGNKGYIGTGDENIGNSPEALTNDFWEYDPSLNNWTRKMDFGGNTRLFAVGFVIGNKGYIGTGFRGTVNLKDFWEYDPTSNLWIQKADFGGSARHEAFGFGIGLNGYIGTGTTGTTSFGGESDFWEYNSTNNIWKRKKHTPDYSMGSFSFSTSSKGYIGGGNINGFFKIYEYVPTEDLWIQKDSIPTPIGGGVQGQLSFTIGNYGYFGFGYTGVNTLCSDELWEYELDSCYTGTTTCTNSISSSGNSVVNTNGTDSVSVTTQNGCTWTATTSDAWITIISGISGSGNGTVTYSFTSNTSASSRTGTITIAGETYTITQDGLTPSGIMENSFASMINISPNPTTGILNLQMSQFKNVQVNIYNVYGESIYQNISPSSNFQIDLSTQPNGVYFISKQTNEGIVNKKIVISK